MASTKATQKMKEEASCSICLNLMTEPQSITCGHSYCQGCIEDFLDNCNKLNPQLDTYSCPQCRAPFQRTSLRPNKQLGSIIEAVKELDNEMMCKDHREQLHLFCQDEGQLICLCCERSPLHKGHATMLVEDACPVYKEELQKAVTNLRELEKECKIQKTFVTNQITKWNRKVEIQTQKIQDDFKDFHSFLQEEEMSYLRRLEKEKDLTLNALRNHEASLENKRCELESHIQDLENRCQSSAQKLLQDVKEALSRSQAVKLETPEAVSLEIQTVCDVSELYFDVRKLLRGYQVNVTLDPGTAHCMLNLSVDQREVTCERLHKFSVPLSRISTNIPSVLGRNRFTSGRHYFEVQLGKGTQWDLGVCMENMNRHIGTKLNPKSGFWAISLNTELTSTALTCHPIPLCLQKPPPLVGVFLDYEAGMVSFYDMTTASRIFTFPRASFSGVLRPYFRVFPFSILSLPPPAK